MINQHAWIKMTYVYNGLLFSNEKKGLTDICNCMDEYRAKEARHKRMYSYAVWFCLYDVFEQGKLILGENNLSGGCLSRHERGGLGMKELSGELEMSIEIWVLII